MLAFVYREVVDHSCFRCGTRVKDGTNFCPHCGAPQIRVTRSMDQVESESTPSDPQTTANEPDVQPTNPSDAAPGYPQVPAQTYSGSSGSSRAFDWTQALPSAALGGVCGAALSLLPLLLIAFPLWMASTGAFAVTFYRRRRHISFIPAGVGARLGALAGTIGFVPFALVLAVQFLLAQRTGVMREYFSHVSTGNPDPEVQQRLQHFVAWAQTPQGAAVLAVAALVFAFVGFLVLGTIGGAVWASITGKKNQAS